MRKLRVISALLVCIMALTSFAACNKSAKSKSDSNTGEESIAVGVKETDAPEVTPKPQKLAAELGDFYALQTALSMDYNPYFGVDYDAGASYVPCFVYDGKIYKGARYGGRDYDYLYYDAVEIYDCETLAQLAYIPVGNDNTTMDIEFFAYNGKVYVYMYNDYDCTNVLYYITDDYVLEEDAQLGTAILDSSYGYIDYSKPYRFIYKTYEYQNGTLIVAGKEEYTEDGLTADLFFLDKDGSIHTVSLSNFCEQFDSIISGFTYGSDLFVIRSTYKYRVIDITNYTEVNTAIPYDVLTSHNIISGKNGHYYVNTLEGFYDIDPDNNEVNKLIDYNCVLGNTSVLYDSRFLFEKNGDYYFFSCLYPEGVNEYSDSYRIETKIFRVTPCENPYQDKIVLDLATDKSDPELFAAIKAYNDSGTDYFVNVHIYDGTIPDCKIIKNESSDRYEAFNDISYEKYAYNNAMKEKIKLAFLDENSDIDLVYGFGLNEAFNTDKLLMDLSPFIENDGSFTDANYYMNIIDAKKNDSGNLYVMPIAIEINALSCPSNVDNAFTKNVTADNGILVTDYEKVLKSSEYLFDPMACYASPFEALNELVSNESDKIVDLTNGTDVFDESLFSSFVEFSEYHSTADVETALYIYNDNNLAVDYTKNTSAFDMICFRTTEGDTDATDYETIAVNYYGIPSSDGRGIAADMLNCISIKNTTDEPDASFGVVKYLMENMKVNSYSGEGYMVNKANNMSIQGGKLDAIAATPVLIIDVDTDLAIKNMDILLSGIDRFRFRDDIITFAYVEPFLRYLQGDVSKDEMIQEAKEAVSEASNGIINSLKN